MTENYFNYFTEIEDHFQRARGTGLFLLSPLDWALIEAWKRSGIPLEAVLRGMTASFQSRGSSAENENQDRQNGETRDGHLYCRPEFSEVIGEEVCRGCRGSQPHKEQQPSNFNA